MYFERDTEQGTTAPLSMSLPSPEFSAVFLRQIEAFNAPGEHLQLSGLAQRLKHFYN